MSCLISRCGGIDLLNGVANRRLDELVIPMFVPVDRKAYENERLMSTIVQAQRIRIAFACPIRQERLQHKRPEQTFDMNMAHRGCPIAVSGVRRGDGGRIVFDSRGGESLAPAGGIERVHFVGRAG